MSDPVPTTQFSLMNRLPNPADAEAWERALQVYGPVVFRLARQQGMQLSDADDLVQNVFADIAQQIDAWLKRPDRGPFRAWLRKIARNKAVNALTRKPVEGRALGGSEAEVLAQLQADSVEMTSHFDAEYHREIFRWAAGRVQNSVSETTWKAFALTHIEMLPISEAAAILNVAPGAIYVARARVMNRLKDLATQFETSKGRQ